MSVILCFARNQSSNMWQWFDDEKVRNFGGRMQLGLEWLTKNGFRPYMLFFQRKTNRGKFLIDLKN